MTTGNVYRCGIDAPPTSKGTTRTFSLRAVEISPRVESSVLSIRRLPLALRSSQRLPIRMTMTRQELRVCSITSAQRVPMPIPATSMKTRPGNR